ncbi:CmpA/NrtA family ABC transporter substrate-binding protein [Calycomorphotria hydatis]|uniref:Bicarbonate transport ATP-binding protein CmpC n=1 Tax=Calycomorphotria hydatis TaxID=2528027 RepID=A0A517T9Z4_9PLAN|nr:CmpA/NrtA family ABC transporter substrate-binding protein [Calycomorphotria hydatis]QDT65195.1 Bicarbonate transport ATP-binding protein CmpC [Calycomorphotria hydatis]
MVTVSLRNWGLTPALSLSFVLLITIALCGCGGGGSTTEVESSSTSAIDTESLDELDLSELLDVEKDELKFGFIKLTDCAPIVIAKEMGYFEDEGLFVEVEAQANWKVLLDRVISGELDGAHMLAGQPIAATIGFGTKAHIITPYSLDLNGNGITVSPAIWKQMQENDAKLDTPTPPHPITADALKPIADAAASRGENLKMGMVFPVSTHNYEIRYWLAAAGIHPGFYTETDKVGTTDADVFLSVTPPPQMPATLEQGTICGYCVGEPWNQNAVVRDIGVAVCTNYEIWKNNPEKVFGITKEFADKNPNTVLALTKALIRAGKWLDEKNADGSFKNRVQAVKFLSQPNYVGADEDVIANSMTGTFLFQKSDRVDMPDFNVFFDHYASYPYYSDAIWFLTQMRRWGQITEPKPDSWYHETAKKVYRPDIYMDAADLLIKEGKLSASDFPMDTDGYKAPTADFIDGVEYDGKDPVGYLKKHEIGNKDEV